MALVDAWGPGHSRASSGGESRIIRMGYGADEIYTRMAMRSLELWKTLGRGLFHRTGVLWIGRERRPVHDRHPRHAGSALGVPREILDGGEMARRYPQMRFHDPGLYGIFEPESGALMARRAVAEVVADAVRMGVRYETTAAAAARRSHGVRLRAVAAQALPGHPRRSHLPDSPGGLLLRAAAGDARFAPAALPVWIDWTDPRGPYGFPDLESRGFKLAFDRHGAPFDPDTGDRRLSDEGLAEARRFLAERFPDLRDAPLTESRVCQYENTSNGDFLIDRHPENGNIWLVGGGSGHGFKHGPAVGEYVADCILRGRAAEPRFALANKDAVQRRTVW